MTEIAKRLLRNYKENLRRFKYQNTIPHNPQHDDIYIVEFPKSGITWLSFILGNIEIQLQGRPEVMTYYNHHKYIVDVHQTRGANIKRFLERTFIKSHAEFNPYYYFVIYLIRHPYDVMVSRYNYTRDLLGYQGTFEEFVASPRFGIQKWSAHVQSWLYKKVNAQRIHFVRYEDLLNDTSTSIQKIYQNMGVKLPTEILEKAIDLSRLEQMKISEELYRNFNPNYTMAFVGKKKKLKKEELLTDSVKNYIDSHVKDIMPDFYG